MKLNWICGVLFAIALTVPASAQVSVYIGSAPPPLRYEQRAPIPGPGMWPHFVNLLFRSWMALVAAMGTTTLAVVVGFVGFLFILALNLVFKLR